MHSQTITDKTMATKKLLIEFSWRGQRITQFIDKDLAFQDIAEKEDFWGEFIIGKDKFQYQIWWNSGEIAIFQYGATDYCAIVDNFSVTFNQRY